MTHFTVSYLPNLLGLCPTVFTTITYKSSNRIEPSRLKARLDSIRQKPWAVTPAMNLPPAVCRKIKSLSPGIYRRVYDYLLVECWCHQTRNNLIGDEEASPKCRQQCCIDCSSVTDHSTSNSVVSQSHRSTFHCILIMLQQLISWILEILPYCWESLMGNCSDPSRVIAYFNPF